MQFLKRTNCYIDNRADGIHLIMQASIDDRKEVLTLGFLTEILRAIEIHTVGAGQMTDLDKVIYVADYIEHNRAFPGVDAAREIASLSLNKAVAYETARTVEHLAHQGFPIYPQTLETYNAFVHYLKED